MAYPASCETGPHRRGRIFTLAAGLLAALTLALPAIALGAPPPNDDFADAEALAGVTTGASGTNVEATTEPGEPQPFYGNKSVWYRWEAPSSGVVMVKATGSGSPTVAVYTGTAVDALTPVAGGFQVRFQAEAGGAYMIMVNGYHGQAGAFQLALDSQPPPNDQFDQAEELTGDADGVSGTNNGPASSEPGEPGHGGFGGASLWYEWTAPSTGGVTLDTAGSTFDTVLAVYTGDSVSTLTQVASNNDASSSRYTSRVTFNAVAGTTYRIAIDSRWGDVFGAAQLSLRLRPPPDNDLFANAIALPGEANAGASGRNDGATAELGEPNHYLWGRVGHSVWYSWTAPKDGSLTIRVDADFHAVPAAYTGDEVGALERVPREAQNGPGPHQLRVRVQAGTTYRIAIDSLEANHTAGDFGLTLTLVDRPPNDDFADAELLEGSNDDADGTNVGATQEPGEPVHQENWFDPSVWYAWTAPETTSVTLDLAGSPLRGVLAVYTGDSVDALTRVHTTALWGQRAKLRFRAEAGQTYRIVVDGRDGAQDTFHLALRATPLPANDDFENAEPLTGQDAAAAGDTRHAYKEPGEPQHAGAWGTASIWYVWTAPSSGGVTLDTYGSSFNTALAVYEGDRVDALTRVVASHTNSNAAGDTRVVFQAVEGQTYRIAVDGYYGDSEGTVALNLRLRAPPDNDLFANATALPGEATVTASGRNDGAGTEPGEPSHYAWNIAHSSVWYSWTAPSSGALTVRVDSSFYAVTAVYTGGDVSDLEALPLQAHAGSGPHNVRVRVAAGTTYRIAVDSMYAQSGGDFSLALSLVGSPPNDDFADAQELTGTEADADGTNVGATQEAGEPVHEQNYNDPSVWYTWTAPATGGVTLDLEGSALDGVVAVYTGDSVDSLTRVHSVTPVHWTARTKRRFRAVAGTTYRIAVDGVGAQQGTFHLALRWTPVPAGDMFADAQSLDGADVTVEGDNIGASGEAGEPLPGGADGASVWFSWTAPATGRARLRIPTSDFGPGLTVFTGDELSALTVVGSPSYAYDGVDFNVEEGTTYRIAVDGRSERRRGVFKLRLVLHEPPPNDDFADALELTGTSASSTQSNVVATREPGEPNHDWGYGERSIWYRWTAPADGRVELSTAGSNFYALLGVYTGDSVDELTLVADDRPNVAFTATAGVTYRIAVDAYDLGGIAKLSLKQTPAGDPGGGGDPPPGGGAESPPHDMFELALMAESGTTFSHSNAGATSQPGEPSHGGSGQSVWYRWTAPSTGATAIYISQSGFDSVLAVYRGASVGALTHVPDESPVPGRHEFRADAGEEYYVAVDGAAPNDSGTFSVEFGYPVPDAPPPDGEAAPPGDVQPQPSQPSQPEPGPVPAPATAPLELSYTPGRQSLADALRRGLSGTVRCSSACDLAATAKVTAATARRFRLRGAATTIARGSASSAGGGEATLTIRFSKATRRKLRRARSVKLTVTVRAVTGGQPAPAVTRRLTLRR